MEEEQTEETFKSGIYQDSFTIGTAAKGGALKCYFDASKLDESDKKIANLLKLRERLEKAGVFKE